MKASSVLGSDVTSSYSGFSINQRLNLFHTLLRLRKEREKVYPTPLLVQKLNEIRIKHLALRLPEGNKYCVKGGKPHNCFEKCPKGICQIVATLHIKIKIFQVT